jgi:RNA 3'-terminal phosphate cyclase (ATP)
VHFTMDTQTAGATTLLAQVALPVALFRPHQTILHLKGGTNADMAPQVDYYASVFKKLLEAFGASFECEVKRRGYFPRGGGHIDLTLSPLSKPLTAIEIVDPGQLSVISIKASAAGKVASSVAQQMASSARAELLKNIPTGVNISVNTDYFDHNQATGSGNSIMIIAETTTGCILGGSAIGSPKKKPETVGLSAAKELLGSLQRRVCLDEYAQDQVIIFMALAKGHSKVLTGPLTLHTKTAIHVAELMTRSKFNVTENSSNGNCLIECDGIGHYH